MPMRIGHTLIAVTAAACLAGCSRRATTSDLPVKLAAREPVPATPKETVERMVELRRLARYGVLRTFVEPAHASGVIDFLLAMDDVGAANAEVQAAIRKRLPSVAASNWDLSWLRNWQSLFSADVRVLDEQVDGDRARVTIRVADVMPLETIEMRREGTRWVYDPGAGPGALPPALHRLATSLRRIAATVMTRDLTERDLRTEFRLRIHPLLRRMASMGETPAVADAGK